MTPQLVRLEPAGEDREVWKVSVADERGETAVDFMRPHAEARSFIGDGGYFRAEPDADGWRLIARAGAADEAESGAVRSDGAPFV